jgi:signal transduction histidine kinase
METTGQSGGPMRYCANAGRTEDGQGMTLSTFRHDIRNQLNAIKLSCALLQRRRLDEFSQESVQEVDRAADQINDLITRFLSDTAAPSLLEPAEPAGRHR